MKKRSVVKRKPKTGLPKKDGLYVCELKYINDDKCSYSVVKFREGEFYTCAYVAAWAHLPVKFTKCTGW